MPLNPSIDVVAYAWREVNGTPLPRALWKGEQPPLVGDEPKPEPAEPDTRGRVGRTWDQKLAMRRGTKPKTTKPKRRQNKAEAVAIRYMGHGYANHKLKRAAESPAT